MNMWLKPKFCRKTGKTWRDRVCIFKKEAEQLAREIKERKVNGHEVNDVLIEEKTDFSEEYYIGILYDTDVRNRFYFSPGMEVQE